MSTAAALCLVGASSNAEAAGFFLQEQSVSGLGAAYAGAAAMPRDASILFYNPAGMSHLPGTNINVGVHLLVPDSDIKDTGSTYTPVNPATGAPVGPTAAVGGGDGGNPYDPTPIPNAYISHQLTDKFWVGLGISAPFGLANEYNDGWFGRYDATETELTTIDIAPSAAYKINDWISVGGSIIMQRATAELKSTITGVTTGTQTLEGESTDFGWKAGVLMEPISGTKIGIDYRSEITHELEGRFIIENAGAAAINTNAKGYADLNLPDIATFSVAQDLNDEWTLLGSATWFGWNDFERIETRNVLGGPIGSIEQNYQSTWAYAIGLEWEMNDTWTWRAGYQYDETPTTDEYRTSRTPDGDRQWFSLGGTYTLDDNWSFDFAGTYIDIADEEIDVTRNLSFNNARVQADTEGHVAIISAGLNYKF